MPRFGEEIDEAEADVFDDTESSITSVSAAAERRRREMRARDETGLPSFQRTRSCTSTSHVPIRGLASVG